MRRLGPFALWAFVLVAAPPAAQAESLCRDDIVRDYHHMLGRSVLPPHETRHLVRNRNGSGTRRSQPRRTCDASAALYRASDIFAAKHDLRVLIKGEAAEAER